MYYEELQKAIEENRLYDHIANNYWQYSKEDLARIILEIVYNSGCDLEDKIMQYNIIMGLEDYGL